MSSPSNHHHHLTDMEAFMESCRNDPEFLRNVFRGAQTQQHQGNSAAASSTSSSDLTKVNWIGRLMEYCQAPPNIYKPDFRVEPASAGFTCTVTIRETPETFGGDSFPFPTKKEARKNAAMLAMNWVDANKPQSHPATAKGPGASGIQLRASSDQEMEKLMQTNWVGKLQELFDTHPGMPKPEYDDIVPRVGHFVAIVRLKVFDRHFGGDEGAFPSKAIAKHFAAMRAYEFLETHPSNLTNGRNMTNAPQADPIPMTPTIPAGTVSSASNGTGTSTVPTTPGRAAPLSANFVRATTPAEVTPENVRSAQVDDTPSTSSKPLTATQQVPVLCQQLGAPPLSYVLESEEGATGFWTVYAQSNGHPRIQGRIGEVKNIYGKTNAKEKCAEKVVRQLTALLERERSVGEQAG